MAKRKILVDPEMCKRCGGKCCKQFPGFMLPEDLRRVNRKTLEELFSTGDYSVDQEDQVRVNRTKRIKGYFVRPKRLKPDGSLPGIADPAVAGGSCTFWDPMEGCKLPHEKRPWECKTLIPDIGECNKHHPPIRGDSRRFAARQWAPYEDIIEEILRDMPEKEQKSATGV